MKKPLYIGVTGFMTAQEVRTGLRCFNETLHDRKFMVGVLASWRSVAGKKVTRPNRYPKVDQIREIFPKHHLALNLIHYYTNEQQMLCKQLLRLVEIAGENLDGFQLNIPWPLNRELKKFYEATDGKKRIVLQIGWKAIDMAEMSPEMLADMLKRYIEPVKVIDDVLFDLSGGTGTPLNGEKLLQFLREIESRDYDINLGVAGGLGPTSIGLLDPFFDEFPNLNIDAEGLLRDPTTDHLDVIKMRDYLREAHIWFHHCYSE